jgi:hypothetical protein
MLCFDKMPRRRSDAKNLKMIKKTLITLTMLIAFGFVRAEAGWYECYNFSGTIDKSPITLSLQIRAGYFGEKEKRHFNVIGLYKYDRVGVPVRLEGVRNTANDKVVLYELRGEKRTATFEFVFSENEAAGSWKNLSTNEERPLNLKFVSGLTDTATENQFAGIEILLADSLKDFYFVGVYSKNREQEDAEMKRLKIFRKKDGSLFQTLDLSAAETPAGNLMTVIFDNVEAGPKSKNFTIASKAGRTGGYFKVNYDLRKKRFVFDPKPVIEGAD